MTKYKTKKTRSYKKKTIRKHYSFKKNNHHKKINKIKKTNKTKKNIFRHSNDKIIKYDISPIKQDKTYNTQQIIGLKKYLT